MNEKPAKVCSCGDVTPGSPRAGGGAAGHPAGGEGGGPPITPHAPWQSALHKEPDWWRSLITAADYNGTDCFQTFGSFSASCRVFFGGSWSLKRWLFGARFVFLCCVHACGALRVLAGSCVSVQHPCSKFSVGICIFFICGVYIVVRVSQRTWSTDQYHAVKQRPLMAKGRNAHEKNTYTCTEPCDYIWFKMIFYL